MAMTLCFCVRPLSTDATFSFYCSEQPPSHDIVTTAMEENRPYWFAWMFDDKKKTIHDAQPEPSSLSFRTTGQNEPSPNQIKCACKWDRVPHIYTKDHTKRNLLQWEKHAKSTCCAWRMGRSNQTKPTTTTNTRHQLPSWWLSTWRKSLLRFPPPSNLVYFY